MLSLMVQAEPTMNGTPGELTGYLSKIPKIITITAEASEKVTARAAQIKLMVLTEAKQLSRALTENGQIRAEVRKQIKAAGIMDKDIVESKFSSTPEYGWFGDNPSAYKVENMISIKVSSEKQLIKVATIADKHERIHFVSSKALIENVENIKNTLIQKALQSSRKKAQLYEQNLAIKLVPVSFNESGFSVAGQDRVRRVAKMRAPSYDEAAPESPARFGESKYSIAMTVNYRVKAK